MQRAVIFFIENLLTSLIFYKGSTLINLGFLIKEDFWYVVFIGNFTRSNVCITLIRLQNFSSIEKNPVELKTYKIRTGSPISSTFRNQIT